MKFIATTNRIHFVENSDCEILFGVKLTHRGRAITTDTWGPHWIFEADEEYNHISNIGIYFMGKARATELIRGLYSMGPLPIIL